MLSSARLPVTVEENVDAGVDAGHEGAILAGYPSDEVEQAVLDNVQAAGYGK